MALIVVIVVNDADILPKVFLDFPGDGGFAAAGAPGDADNHSLSRCTHDECPLVSFYQSFGVSAAGDLPVISSTDTGGNSRRAGWPVRVRAMRQPS